MRGSSSKSPSHSRVTSHVVQEIQNTSTVDLNYVQGAGQARLMLMSKHS
jgi:hypothetical protein